MSRPETPDFLSSIDVFGNPDEVGEGIGHPVVCGDFDGARERERGLAICCC